MGVTGFTPGSIYMWRRWDGSARANETWAQQIWYLFNSLCTEPSFASISFIFKIKSCKAMLKYKYGFLKIRKGLYLLSQNKSDYPPLFITLFALCTYPLCIMIKENMKALASSLEFCVFNLRFCKNAIMKCVMTRFAHYNTVTHQLFCVFTCFYTVPV